ncbi:MAG TPA: F0F1 ATP synthase subunit A [Anaeromyxobacter sp.]
MITAPLVGVALSLLVASTEPAAPGPGAPVAQAPAAEGHAEHGAAVEGHALPVEGRAAAEGEGHAAKGHGEGEEKEGLSEVLMHHVTDGYRLEYPGYCHGAFAWNCEVDLREVFGDLKFTVAGVTFDMTPTKHLVMMWLASIVLLVMLFSSLRRKNVVPSGLYNFFEMLVQFVRNEIALKNIGEKDGDRFVPYLVTAFFFILFVNLFGLVPYAATATGNLAVTVALAVFTFVITQYAAIKAMGLGAWLKHLTGGVAVWLWPIMVPVEILGLFTKPFALTVRLFANMLAGHIVILSLLGLIYALNSQWVAFGSVPMALGIFLLELFVGFVQAYIFTMLSSLFIGQGLAHHGHDEEHEHGHAGPGMGSADPHGSHVAGTAPGHG